MDSQSKFTNEALVQSYILGTHGSLPNIDYSAMGALLSEDFAFSNEEQHHDKATLLGAIFPGWASIVDGKSTSRIHAVIGSTEGDTVLAHWETDYDVREGSVWYGTDVDISGKKVRGFQVFANFTVKDGKITKITQRSDTVTKHLGIEKEVNTYRNRA